MLGVLADDDVSLTFDADQPDGAPALRRDGPSRSATTSSRCSRSRSPRDGGDPSVSWVGYLGYACRTDLPGRPADPASGVPDAVWMRLPRPPEPPAEASPARGRGVTRASGSQHE